MKPSPVLTEEIIHPDVRRLMIDKKKVCPNGKIRDDWTGDFQVHGDRTQVSSLEGCPRAITDRFEIIYQKHLNSLNGSPERAKHVDVWNCSVLKDLNGIPSDCDSYSIYDNERLLSLDGIPTHQALDLYLSKNPNLSFTNCQFPLIKALRWGNNKDVSLHDFHRHFPKITDYLMFSAQIKSHVLSVLLVEELKEVVLYGNLKFIGDIINKYLPNTTGKKGMLRCQAELIDAGYEEYAQL